MKGICEDCQRDETKCGCKKREEIQRISEEKRRNLEIKLRELFEKGRVNPANLL